MEANGREEDCLLYWSSESTFKGRRDARCHNSATEIVIFCSLFSCHKVQKWFWHQVAHVTINLLSFMWSIGERIRCSAGGEALEDRSGTGEFSRWLSLEFSVLSYSTVQPFISIFGPCLTLPLLGDIQPFFIGPVPLTLGLDAGQIDWKNTRCLVPDTSLSITLAPRREEKVSLRAASP